MTTSNINLSEKKELQKRNHREQAGRRVMRAETFGIMLITLLILVIALIRYGDNVPWGAR